MDTDWTFKFNDISERPRGKKRKSAAKRKEWIKKYGENLFTFSSNPPSPPVYFSSRDEFLKIYNK